MNRNKSQIQQGDVLLKRISLLPEGARPVPREDGQLIIARGELTGHSHSIAQKGAFLFELNGELYLKVTMPVVLVHDEHKPITIPQGVYEIGRIREYDYFLEMERGVKD